MPRMRDIPERSRRRVAIIFPVRTLSGRPGRGFFAHLLRPRRRSRPRQEQQQDDQQRPRRARSSPITPHILPTVLHASHTRAHRLSTKWTHRARTFGPHAVLHQDGVSSKTLEFITRLGFPANCLPVGDDVIKCFARIESPIHRFSANPMRRDFVEWRGGLRSVAPSTLSRVHRRLDGAFPNDGAARHRVPRRGALLGRLELRAGR